MINIIKKTLKYFSIKEKDKRLILKYEKKQEYYSTLSGNDIIIKHIELKSMYECKNNILKLILVILLVGVLSGLTTKVFDFIYFLLKSSLLVTDKEISLGVLYLTIIIYIFISLLIIFSLIIYIKDIREIKKEILLIEKIQLEKNRKTNTEFR
ncbi:hypothetical protein [Helcococcus kunzii]|uniref:hypothetical protein n=1 Tax=Helcococcus kunzii TaxID=40091 RepID=UPI0024AD5D00|nr:hypothetical protein [Helcococcus kunzii]